MLGESDMCLVVLRKGRGLVLAGEAGCVLEGRFGRGEG